MLPRGSKVTKAIRRAAGRPARTPTHERGGGGGRLSDSLIKECEQSKPLCCSTVNRIRETLVPSPLGSYPPSTVIDAGCAIACVPARAGLFQRWGPIARAPAWTGGGNDSGSGSADKPERREEEGRKERSRIAFGHSGNEPQELKSAVPPGRKPALQLKFPVSSDCG